MAPLTRSAAVRAAVLLLLVVLAGVLFTRSAAALPTVVGWVGAQGVLAPVAYAAIYAVSVPLLVPGSLLTLTAGALFGLWPGVPVTFVGAVAGSSLAFFASRHGARPFAEHWVGDHPRLAAIDRAVTAEGARVVFLLRLTPLIPFTVLNYLLGLTHLRWRDLLLASPGMLPGTFLYVYYGHVIGDVTAVISGARPPHSPLQYAVLATGLVAAFLAAWRVSRVARRALDTAAPAADIPETRDRRP